MAESDMAAAGDRWADWLIRGRAAGRSAADGERMQRELSAIRDRVLAGAELRAGDVALDAGCGTGLLAFGALDLVGDTGRVIGVDISAGALDEMRRVAAGIGVSERLELRAGSVPDLPLPDAAVDAVVDRSVLIYVDDKRAVAREYARVLRPGGRASIFEPINAEARHAYGFELRSIEDLHERVEARKQAEAERTCRSMIDFGVDDLRRAFEAAGFTSVQIEMDESRWSTASGEEWRKSLDRAPNPLSPAAIDLITDVLGAEADDYVDFMAAGVDRGGYRFSCPTVYLTAKTQRRHGQKEAHRD